MLNSAFTLDEAAYSSVSGLCENFVRQSGAACALLVGQDGMLLHKSVSVADLDVDSLSALSAGAFASTREMAGLIGEADFDVVMQQGRRNHLQLIRVGDCAILVAVFDDRTTAGMVRLHGQRVARRLARLLAETEAGGGPEEGPRRAWTEAPGEEAGPAMTLEANGRDPIESGSHTPTRAERLRTALRLHTLSLVMALLAAAVAVLGALLHR
jgi:predicted regulator of Ras-like GTPase activity (Roadblock/LC7/MglB family)